MLAATLFKASAETSFLLGGALDFAGAFAEGAASPHFQMSLIESMERTGVIPSLRHPACPCSIRGELHGT